jgi:tRNA(Arg) A34 adenosine deaminase TadA
MRHTDYMQLAIEAAHQAREQGDVPVGAVLVCDGRVIARAHNTREALCDPAGHAELNALRAGAQALGRWRMTGCTLYVTLEPCPMCAAAISFARVARLYYGAADPKGGGVEHGPRVFSHATCHHRPELYPGLSEDVASDLLRSFFTERRGD